LVSKRWPLVNSSPITNVIDMSWMFADALIFNQDIGSWNVDNVMNMDRMFWNASSFNQDISNWDVSNVTRMNRMFSNALSFNQDIGNWNVTKVTDMNSMFSKASSFSQDIGSWNIASVIDLGSMLNESGMDCDKYTSTLIGWKDNSMTPNGRSLGAVGLEYGIEAEAARDYLISTKGWTFNGDRPSGIECLMSVKTETKDLNSTLKLFPNPCDNELFVEYSGDEQVTIVLYDQLSRMVIQQPLYKSTTINTASLPQGLYIYTLNNQHQLISSGKIVKQ